jgi:predicted ATPase/class 3 adenylate cyclase
MAIQAPSGVVSFLMTDVEDSTRMWESDRAGMAASLALHDELCRRAVVAHDGYVFSTAGDAFAIAFGTPDAAVDAALTIQSGLSGADWPGPPLRVRMGIHTGTADERDGDYFGPSVNRAARVMSAGHGGQVLTTGVVANLLRSRIGSDVELIDHGEHRLAGLEEAERIFEIPHPGAPEPGALLKTADARKTNLGDVLSSFIGRSRELEDVARRLGSQRLVVLTGTGGTGKTRLATEAGRRAISKYPDGAWLVELASVPEPSRVMHAIGNVFGLRPTEHASIDEVVERHLASRNMLLIVDNCEHVLSGAAAAIRRILDAAPEVRIVATSRESLGIDGEAIVRVPSLPLPDGAGGESADSVVLFRDRAATAVPDFEPGSEDWPAIARICRRVDGIPLAIELAAARVRTLSPVQLADRLDDSFQVLVGPAKSSLSRHRTLDATIGWSYELLEENERDLFRRISVFSGGFDLPAATSVARTEIALDVLDSLVDKSLVLSDRIGHAVRFRMLEPVRQYAREQLDRAGDTEEALIDHAEHFLGWVAAAAPHTRGPDQLTWDRLIDQDYDNIRTGFCTLRESGRLDGYFDMAFDLFMYWVHSGLQMEAITTCLAGLEDSAAADPLRRVKCWFVVSVMGAELTSPAAIEHARAGLEISQQLDDPGATGRMELALGAAIRHSTTDPDYLEHLLEARRILDANPEPAWWEPAWDRALVDLLLSGYLPTSDDRAGQHAEAAVTTFERLGDRAMMGAALVEGIGPHGFDSDRTVADLRRAIDIFEEVRAGYWQAHARFVLGAILRLREQFEEAAIHLERGAEELDDLGDVSCWSNALRWLAHCESALGMSGRARGHLVEVIDRFDQLPMREIGLPRTVDAVVVALHAAGMHKRAAEALGCAQTIPFDAQTIIPRGSTLEDLAVEIARIIGDAEFEHHRATGAAADPRAFLQTARSWLVESD